MRLNHPASDRLIIEVLETMCGIAGIFSRVNGVSRERISRMIDRLIHRGPDSGDIFVDKFVALGCRRLAVIDTHRGSQPMFNEDGSVITVFNGMIYNFRELRLELEDAGHFFSSSSDTEVIIHGYEEYGVKGILQRIEGMFAFALFDRKTGRLVVARDRFGEKPLYYFETAEKFSFASELKALSQELPSRRICNESLNYFFALTYIPAPYTIYENVFKLMPGHYLEVSSECINDEVYFTLPVPGSGKIITDFETAKEELRHLLENSVKMRMFADVPIGSFLSGGIDSGIVSTLMSRHSSTPLKTFSIGFNEQDYDESDRSRFIAQTIGADQTLLRLDYNTAKNHIDSVIRNYDEPFADASAVSTYFAGRIASEKVKVVLVGDAADELFGGYEKYLALYYRNFFRKLPELLQKIVKTGLGWIPLTASTSIFLRKARKLLQNSKCDDFTINYNLMCMGFNDQERFRILPACYSSAPRNDIELLFNSIWPEDPLERFLYIDQKIVLEGCMLPKIDRACMQSSLETRAPFLDSKLADFAARLPLNFKIKGRNKKYILKEAFKDVLPRKVLAWPKRGFRLPIDRWFRNELSDEFEACIDRRLLARQDMISYPEIKLLYDEHRSMKCDHSIKLWTVYVFQKWWMNEFKEF